MSDTWGTLRDLAKPDGAAQNRAELAAVAVATPAAHGNPAAATTPAAETVDPDLLRRFQRCAAGCGYLVVAIGCCTVIGWLTGIPILTSFHLGWPPMKVNTALCLIAAGTVLCLSGVSHGPRFAARQASILCALFIIALASATLAEDVSGVDLGIDLLLFNEPGGLAAVGYPGRMAPLTALTLVLYGATLLAAGSIRPRWRMLASTLALLGATVSVVVLLGFFYGASATYPTSARFTTSATNTSIAFILLGSGILFSLLPIGLLGGLTSPNSGGIMLRRMLPVAILLPPSVVWLRLLAQSAGLFGSIEFGGAIVAVVLMISMTGILIWCAGALDRIDRSRRRGDEHIVQLNAALNSRVRALEAANQELQGFSYSMSHVLRAPLRAIHGYAHILVDEFAEKLGLEGRRLLASVQSNAQEMSELVDGILAFLRLGWQPMAIAQVSMQSHVQSVIALLENRIMERNVRFEIGDLPDARADASMMQRVWFNLLDNAVKFTAAKDPATIEVGARSGGDQMIYFVQDNGAGFDMQYAGKLFGVFQRLHNTSQFPGTGIGLAIVNRIITRHGGRVWAEGRPDEGATFYFSLPITENFHG